MRMNSSPLPPNLDHFDQDVEASLRRDLAIITTPHAKSRLASKGDGESFSQVYSLDFWESIMVDAFDKSSAHIPRMKVTGMPGKHVGNDVLGAGNDFLKAVPPTNGCMLELGHGKAKGAGESEADFVCGYRIYISGDTLLVSDLTKIPEPYIHAGKPIDLMLIHLGGTTIPGPSLPLLMVIMDAKQGIELVKLVQPDVANPIHYDDYNVFLSPLKYFKYEVVKAGWQEKVICLDRGEEYKFQARG